MSDQDRPVGANGTTAGPGVPPAAPTELSAPSAPAAPTEPSAPFAAADDDGSATQAGPPLVPADPAAYDTERSAAARKRGLSTPYVPGGRDPELAKTERDERRLLRWLLIMVIVIVLAGFVLGMAAALLGLNGLVGIPD